MRIRSIRRVPLVLFALSALFPARAAVVYVNRNATGAVQDGKTWPTAFTTVQAGVNAAVSGDEVWVAASTPASAAYVENVTMANDIALYGGFSGREARRAERDRTANVTVLDGNGVEAVITVPLTATQGVIVEGFTIRNGGNSGVLVIGVAEISNNTITANSAQVGGGIRVETGSATICNNAITANHGYGISVYYGSCTVSNNTISRNTWAGIDLTGTGTVANNIVAGNGSSGLAVDGKATICNNTFTANSGPYGGGVILVRGVATMTGNLVAFNGSGVVVLAGFDGQLTLRNNDVYGNLIYDFSGLADPTGTDGNISADPLLSSIYQDIHIQPGSPCIDAGEDGSAIGSTDAYGKARIVGAHVDIGAEESDGTAWTVVSSRWYVSQAGHDGNDGLSWGTAKRTVGAALDMCRGGDEVWVAKGTYAENLALPPGASLYGGFAGVETRRDQRDWWANVTVLDGTGSGAVVSARHNGVVLDGFTIRNGSVEGGVAVRFGAATISNNTITANVGYGVSVQGSAATISNNTITANTGCGISVDWLSKATISNNAVSGHHSGGIYVSSAATISNNTIAANSGIAISASEGPITIANNIVAFNFSTVGISLGSGTFTLRNNNVYGHTYVGIANPTGTNGNISADPHFRHFYAGPDRIECDLRLGRYSQCINAGDDSSMALGQTDLDGLPRKIGAHVDIGAYEYPAAGSYTMADAALAFRIAGGLARPEHTEFIRLNVETGSTSDTLDRRDVVLIARKASGLDTGP